MSKLKKSNLALMVVAALLCSSINCLPSAHAEVPGVRDHINRGNMFLSRRAYEEAIKEYDEALKLDPTNSIAKGNIVVAHTNWGISLANRNQYKEAMEQWQLCLTLSPGYKDAVRNMALLRSKLERANQLDLIGEGDEGGNVIWQGDKINKSDKGKKESATSPAKDNANAPSSIKILTPGIKQNPESGLQSYDMSTMGSSSPSSSKPAEATTQSQSSPAPVVSSGNTMDEQLGQIETKVYGSRQTNMPVIQRLQKLETDAAGHPRTGTIKERIDFLRQTWGL